MKTRMNVLAGLVALLLVAVGGCSDPLAPCQEEVAVVVYDSWGCALPQFSLESHQQNGWDCRVDTDLKNAFGETIGTRYICTRCEGG